MSSPTPSKSPSIGQIFLLIFVVIILLLFLVGSGLVSTNISCPDGCGTCPECSPGGCQCPGCPGC